MRLPAWMCVTVLFACTGLGAFAETDQPGGALAKANRLSSLTGPSAQPFHVKVTVSEPENASSPYQGTIEEWWRSPTEWQLRVETKDFKQMVRVEGGQRVEHNDGEYFPLWLRNFARAVTDPLEDSAFWEQIGARVVMVTTRDGMPTTSCARGQFKIGSATVNNDAFAVICFNADGTLSSLVRPGYSMEFQDQRPFGKKRVAYRYVDHPEPGTELVGRVELLESLGGGALPAAANENVQSPPEVTLKTISQSTFERLASDQSPLTWPPVHSGRTSGVLSLYVSADREGRVREVYPLNSDNAGLEDAARDELLRWHLKPAVVDGKPVQVEAALTFAFATSMEGTPAAQAGSPGSPDGSTETSRLIRVSSGVVSSLLARSFAPTYPENMRDSHIGGRVVMKAIISKDGNVTSLTPMSYTSPEFASAAVAAVQQWKYHPYLLNGKPVEVETTITVNFNVR